MKDEPIATGAARGAPNVWTAVGLAIVAFGPLALTSVPMQEVYALGGSTAVSTFIGQACLWLVLGLVLLCLTLGERLPLASVGLTPPTVWSVLRGLGVGVAVYAFLFGAVALLLKFDLFEASAASGAISDWPLWLRVFTLITAGVVEEALYRGYAIERLTAVVGRRWLAAVIALAAFALAHVPFWGLGAIATPILGGGFFTMVYLWRRDLIACMVAHCAVDFVGLIVAPAMGQG